MKWVNPPVAYMLHAGVPLLLDADGDRDQLNDDATADLLDAVLFGVLLGREPRFRQASAI